MFKGWWLRAFEIWLTGRLLASPTFHRMVGRVHRRIQIFRYGTPPEEMGGTKIDNNNGSGAKHFLQLFKDELSEQFKGKPRNR
ncbi:hypothetical protein DTO166G4_6529 [Paecilomyces variotii]|nr:hypothetical protein DTO032I3_3614 [Paecilomyces variotii]KAJ9211877.1 hypothetical protein DTO166G4_6529 [Paecilomyces variotii]KAJ9230370.1 hypothetical protein DTO166G5_7335 [Paecilomyces variotii]KAJ9234134.1 hypothetical protein DTO169E5_6711 [Paecilomyces variotii]KAJ9249267.1 hypothetical protein DTO207G8_6774 [Paecilomyces variotii]